MNITKYQHACLVIEKGGERLVIDPGVYSTDFVVPENVVGVVITHEHPDHLDLEKLKAIVAASPDAVIYAHDAVIGKVGGFKTQAVSVGEPVPVGKFMLRFTGGEHALIHETVPRVANLGVIVDDALYYPGDSLVLPNAAVHTLALPASGPWLKISEAMDFLVTVKPVRAFPTHDAHFSDIGRSSTDNWLSTIATNNGIEYERLVLGTPVEL